MDRTKATFVEGMGAAAATSGVLTQLQGRIFALLYLNKGPLSLDDIAARLQQSKSNISVQIRGLVEWHLVRRIHVGGSRKDHYQAATDFVRVMTEIMERRFRWNLRQVLSAVEETHKSLKDSPKTIDAERKFLTQRLNALGAFFSVLDASFGNFKAGQPFPPLSDASQPKDRKK